MKRLSTIMMCLLAMMAASLSAKAQEVTITLFPGWNWISYPNAEVMDVASALGEFVPMNGDKIKSQFTNSAYYNGYWRGGVTHFMPGYGYMYYSNRTEVVSFVFNKPPMPTGTLIVTTGELSNITSTTAACGGSAVSNDGTTILMKGVCWATHPQPTTNDSYTEDGNGPGAFTAEMTELAAETEYYVRAYAVSVKGINYGEELSFTTAPQGILNGLFSVSENNQVCFSQGNLQYQASTNTWRFAENQWDFVGNNEVGTVYENGVKSDNTLVSSTYDGWIDLFCWGRGNEPTNVTGREWDVFVDWGINPISNGGNCPNQWWTLSLDELLYLFVSRNTPSGIRYAKAVVNEINGIVLLPDDWQESYYTLNNPNAGNSSYASNIISLDDWASLESYGAVFFPAAGMRYGEIYGSGSGGRYWSCTDMCFDNRGHTMSFSDEDFSIGSGLAFYKDFGQSVRLVRFVQTPSFNINATPNQEEYGSVNGGGVYELGQTCTLSAISNEGYTFKNWEMDGVVVSRENTYSFVVRNDKNYVAIFYENATYPLTYSYNEEDYTATVTGHWDGSNATGDLIIPETVIHNGETYTVTAIDAWAFSECSGLTSVDIPNTVSIIGGGAFYKCSHLSMIAIPSSVTRIENMTFHSSGLVSVSLPENLTEIGQWAFHSCTNLVSVSIPNTVTAIGAQAFIYCYSLVSASLPSGITTIPHGLFQSCGNLTSITIPSGVTNIVSYAFLGCHSLASITILAETPPALDESLGDIFVDVNKSIPAYIPCGSLEAYQNAEGWSSFTNFIEMCNGGAPTGAINGLFSINSNGDQVHFSQGNLQYQASTNTWRFAEHQWDYVGNSTFGTVYENGVKSDNSLISATYDGWIDMFGWGTSGYNHGANSYQPWSISESYSDYYAYGSSNSHLYEQTGQADWGYNIISNGGNQENLWRSLSNSEWDYLLNTRNTTSGIRFAKTYLNDIAGLVIMPDNWEESIYYFEATNDATASYSTNSIELTDWDGILQPAGVVFLPAAGARRGMIVSSERINWGMYWTASCRSNSIAYPVSFSNSHLDPPNGYDNRFNGQAVRLVHTYSTIFSYSINAVSNPFEGGIVTGTGNYAEGSICTLIATANAGYTFINWTENGEVVSTEVTYSFTVETDRTFVANFAVSGGDHTYVDLGLPSGTLWATCNVGAVTPEDYGDYFAWGETQPKATYNWSTYQHCNGSSSTLTKYCNNSSYGYNGFTDNLTTLLPEDDAATANWGNDWRMPTKEEWQELYNNTTVTWTQQNGVNGRLFTATNGNSLFLPAAGCRAHRLLNDAGSYGYYWSSSLDTDGPYLAWYFSFYSGNFGMSYFHRYHGESVRAVRVGSQNTAPTGAINGKFTINDNGDQVYFSQGNLQYIGSASTPYWKFADNQWDILGTTTGQNSSSQNVDRDLFGWGTSGWNNGNVYYQPYDTQNNGSSSQGYGYGPTDGTSYTYNLTGTYANADWGVYNPISNGGNQANQWRTLTHPEWAYVFYTRTTSSGIRYAKAKVNDMNGVILLPDDWSSDTYSLSNTNSYGASYSSNTISASQWNTLEQAGAVFLPAAGYRDGTSVNNVGSDGDYWSASCNDSGYARSVGFSGAYLGTGYSLRYLGNSVRLVAPAEN